MNIPASPFPNLSLNSSHKHASTFLYPQIDMFHLWSVNTNCQSYLDPIRLGSDQWSNFKKVGFPFTPFFSFLFFPSFLFLSFFLSFSNALLFLSLFSFFLSLSRTGVFTTKKGRGKEELGSMAVVGWQVQAVVVAAWPALPVPNKITKVSEKVEQQENLRGKEGVSDD